MKLDLYTKVVLTIIAGCLLWICVRDITVGNYANAQQDAQRVKIVGLEMGIPLPVQINAISRDNTSGFGQKWDALKVTNDGFPLIVVEQKPTPTPTPTPSPK